MKRTLILLTVLAMMALVMSAQAAYQIKFQVWSGASTTTVSNMATSTTALPPQAGQGDVIGGAWINNVVSGEPTLITLQMAGATTSTEWHGKVLGRGTVPEVTVDVRFYTSASSTAAPGTWYVFKGNSIGTLAQALDSGVFLGKYTYAGADLKTTALAVGDTFTVADHFVAVPEPGSIIAVLTGLVGLVGLRRRK
jgi:hypothetical protein